MGWMYRRSGWWCPRHPWPPVWARMYTPDPENEIRYLENMKKDLEISLEDISKRIEELRRMLSEKKQ
ncbi:MAG: DUF5320 domain-containing protein [Nitrososphaeria archaeon]